MYLIRIFSHLLPLAAANEIGVSLMRFLLFLLLICLALAGLHLVLLYGFLPYAELGPSLNAANAAAQLAAAPQPPQRLAHSPESYAQLRAVAFAIATAGIVGLACWRRALKHEMWRLLHEVRRAGQVLGQRLRGQTQAAWFGTAVLLLTVAVVRFYFLANNPFNADEQVTADYFTAPGAAVTAGFYLLPNNHVLYNLLAGAALRIAPTGNPDVLMRVPAIVLGLMGLVVGFVALAHITGWRIAALVTLVFQLSPMAVEYATVARAYGLQTLCVQAAALATLVLLRSPAYHRLAWVVWTVACVAGFYFIPTFWYAFAGLGTALLLAGDSRVRRLLRRQVLVAGVGVSALAAVLYLPIGWLSGWPLLLANPYVRSQGLGAVVQQFPHHWQLTAGGIYGSSGLALPLLGLLVLAPLAVSAWGRPALRPVAWVAWVGTVAPWPLLLAQRVLPPARTLHYTAWLTCLLAALVLHSVARRWPARATFLWTLAFALSITYAGTRLVKRFQMLEITRREDQDWRQTEAWLATRPARMVLTTIPGYEVFFTHRAWVQGRPRPCIQFVAEVPVAHSGEFLVLNRPERPLSSLTTAGHYRAAFCNGSLCVYAPAR